MNSVVYVANLLHDEPVPATGKQSRDYSWPKWNSPC